MRKLISSLQRLKSNDSKTKPKRKGRFQSIITRSNETRPPKRKRKIIKSYLKSRYENTKLLKAPK